MDALTLLLERRSCPRLTAPAPSGAALDDIVRAATRVPDFKRLHPHEFLIAEGDGLERLGAMFGRAALASGRSAEVVESASRMPSRAPMVIVVVAKHRPSPVVDPLEQKLSAGCSVMAMQLAAIAQGFGGIWRSGWAMFDRGLHAELGLADEDQIVGFLYLGTPAAPPQPAPEFDPNDYVRRI